ncbi:MAG: ATP-dependent metallopeptidase FtsH/Yme1/Tma family protein [Candidatus Methanofastidiosum sp.]|nr:ATP-dependent metallopeptidase FtsH/Yme1/Tma family protein [Methanofastidiosum sp.]
MKNWIKNILTITFILLAAVLLFGGSFLKESPETKNIAISELAAQINSGNISDITIKENVITSVDKEGVRLISKTGLNESFFDFLKYYEIDAKQLSLIEVTFEEKVDWGNII